MIVYYSYGGQDTFMRLLTTDSLCSGAILGKTIFNERGSVLVSAGTVLTEKMIKRLIDFQIPFVYIEDEKSKEIEVSEVISSELRIETIQTIQSTFEKLNMNDVLDGAIVVEKATAKFTDLIRTIMEEMQNQEDLLTLIADVYLHDKYIFSHSLNVALYSLALGTEMNLDNKQLETLGMGALLHDVGKMLIPLDVLKKPEKLSDAEFEKMQKHAEYGFHLIKNIHTLSLHIAHCAYQHHERMDGSGYPRGLKGDQIHELAKIIAVADVFDAVTSRRVYREALLPHEALELLYAGAGNQFDVQVVDAFRRAVAIYPNGLEIELNDGRKGLVARQNIGIGDRPIIRITEENGEPTEKPYDLDLKENHQLLITKCLINKNA